MNICLVKVTGRERAGLLPADSDAEEVVAKMVDGECSMFKLMRIRSVPWHRLYYGICRKIGQNQEPPRTEGSIDYEIRILSGHYTPMFIQGIECRMPNRIAFDQLTADEWSEYWMKAEPIIIERFGIEYLDQCQRGAA